MYQTVLSIPPQVTLAYAFLHFFDWMRAEYPRVIINKLDDTMFHFYWNQWCYEYEEKRKKVRSV